VMRPSILPQLISCYQKNRLNSEKGFRIFELRTIYHVSAEGTIKESLKLVGLYVGNPMGRNRFGYERNSDLFDGKGILKSLFKNAHISVDERVYELWPYHPGQTLGLYHNNHQLAIIGALHPELLQEQKIKETLYSFEIDFEYFVQIYQQEPLKFHAVSSLPSVYRDLALLVPQEVTYQNILEAIDKEKPEFLKDVDLFDLYEGENLPKNKKSIAISMIYEPKQQSLTDDEVNKMHFKLVETLKTKLGVELR